MRKIIKNLQIKNILWNSMVYVHFNHASTVFCGYVEIVWVKIFKHSWSIVIKTNLISFMRLGTEAELLPNILFLIMIWQLSNGCWSSEYLNQTITWIFLPPNRFKTFINFLHCPYPYEHLSLIQLIHNQEMLLQRFKLSFIIHNSHL